MPVRRPWTEDELLVAMNLYCKLPFGKLNHGNADIVALALKLDRTPSSVSMKLCNFASFDPTLAQRGIKGLRGASQADRRMWDAFQADWTGMAERSEAAFEAVMAAGPPVNDESESPRPPDGPSEVERTVKSRRLQSFFRRTVLASYEYRCAVSGVTVQALLNASHIIPWRESESRRADPTNGLCLNAIYDRAFDRGLITFDEDLRMVVASCLKQGTIPAFQRHVFVACEGSPLHLPHRFRPDPDALQRHREMFLG